MTEHRMLTAIEKEVVLFMSYNDRHEQLVCPTCLKSFCCRCDNLTLSDVCPECCSGLAIKAIPCVEIVEAVTDGLREFLKVRGLEIKGL